VTEVENWVFLRAVRLQPVLVDDACILRYLRARSFNEDKAEKMMKATIEWRKEYKPHLTQRDEIAEVLVRSYV
jgi:hypothetical protein